MINQQIQNYKILSLLGEGGMGTVYLAEHVKLGRKVAIKSLHAQFVNSKEIRARFMNEAKVMAQLQHPNIVNLYDYVETENGLYLIIELVDGKPIDEYIEQVSGPIEEEKAIAMMHEILEGFQYAHEMGLVHRDIKPSNLVISAKNKVKILDFGIAKMVGDTSSKMTKTGTQIGTVYYMSPEQVKGDDLDHRSDIYALGVTFFQMLTGSSPYKGMTKEFEVFMKIVNEDLPDPRTIYPGISDHMCAVIQKATARDANERFQSCDEFIKGLKTDNFVVSNKTTKEEVIIPTVLPIKNAVLPNNMEEKQHLSEKEIALEKPEKKNKKLMLFLLAGIGFVTLFIIIITLTKGNKKPLDAPIQNEAIMKKDKGNQESLDTLIQNQSNINKVKENPVATETTIGKDGRNIDGLFEYEETKSIITAQESEPETFVDEEAKFPGGYPAMMAFIQKNVVFPETAIEMGVQGKCFLRFVVNINGTISEVQVTKGVPNCPDCDKSAIKAIRAMPNWEPGKLNGRSVSSYCSIPINFAIE